MVERLPIARTVLVVLWLLGMLVAGCGQPAPHGGAFQRPGSAICTACAHGGAFECPGSAIYRAAI